MIKNLKRYKKNLEREGKTEDANNYNFFPQTFHLPSEYPLFYEEFKKQSQNGESKTPWIMKPIGKSQGKGIFIINKIQSISQWKNTLRFNQEAQQAEAYIVQKYIADPLLIGGKKFDMRIYLLCTSYQPLTLYLYRTGFARFTHHRYDNEDISNILKPKKNQSIFIKKKTIAKFIFKIVIEFLYQFPQIQKIEDKLRIIFLHSTQEKNKSKLLNYLEMLRPSTKKSIQLDMKISKPKKVLLSLIKANKKIYINDNI